MDYFKVPQPCCISFSGGLTSAYMLRRILDAFGGTLPNDVVAVFANTGKEREETLQFVKDCGERWGVEIVWLEHCFVDGSHSYKRVSFETASRKGEPFEDLINSRETLPNPTARYCTAELKVRTIRRFLVGELGWSEYYSAVGLRADEPSRVAKIRNSKERGEPVVPLYNANIDENDVLSYWRNAPFALQLKSYEGNCDLCFLKSASKIQRLIDDNQSCAEWWITQEKKKPNAGAGRLFREDRPSYQKFLNASKQQIRLPLIENEEDNMPCDCTD